MKPSELAMTMANMKGDIVDRIYETVELLHSKFESNTQDNEESANLEALHSHMVDYLIFSDLNSMIKKKVELAKTGLDTSVDMPDGTPGQTVVLGSTNLFEFKKKQNNNSDMVHVTSLKTALARLGVDKATIDAAVKDATKPKKGNTYYIVSLKEE